MIPKEGARIPIKIREGGDMWREVLPKRIAVDVIVVKPMWVGVHQRVSWEQ